MNTKKLTTLIIVGTLIFLFGINTGFPQRKTEGQSTGQGKQELQKIKIKGKIAYMKSLGGYYVQGEDPSGEFIIENPNPKVLKALMKQEKIVIIEGRLTMGADLLMIEKIDGKKYRAKTSLSK